VIAQLILHDMDSHRLNNENLEEFKLLPYRYILLLSGLAELHANCEMFGGKESESFKIKFKRLEKFGSRVL
jgi:hypothetical protein